MPRTSMPRPFSLALVTATCLSALACSGGGGSSSSSDPVLSFGTTTSTVDEDAGTVTVALALSKAARRNTSIEYTLAGDAVAGTDYELLSANPLVIPEGDTEGLLEFRLLDSNDYEGIREVQVQIDDVSGADLDAQSLHVLRIVDDEFLLSFQTASSQVADGSGLTSLTVLFSDKQDTDVTIPLTIGGPAIEGVDFEVPNATLVMPAGEEFVQFPLNILDSPELFAGTRAIEVELGTPSKGFLGPNATHAVEIEYADLYIEFSQGASNTSDDVGALTLSVELSLPQTFQVIMPFQLGGDAVRDTDYVVDTDFVTFPAGQTSVPLVVEIENRLVMGTKELTIQLQPSGPILAGNNALHTIEIEYAPFDEVEPNGSAPEALAVGLVGNHDLGTQYQIRGRLGDVSGTPPATDLFDVFHVRASIDSHASFTLTPLAAEGDLMIVLTNTNGTPITPWVNPNGAGVAETLEFDLTAAQDVLIVVHRVAGVTDYELDIVGSAPAPDPLAPPAGGEPPAMGLGYYEWMALHGLAVESPELVARRLLLLLDEAGEELGRFETQVRRR